MKGFFTIVCVLVLGSSCSNHQNDVALAKVGDEYLYIGDCQWVFEGVASSDSISVLKNYVNSWVEQELIAQKAEQELSSDEKDFEKQMASYRQSLLIQKYESNFLKKNMDTVVTDKEIKSYYQSHLAEFGLQSNILRLNFVKFRLGSPSVEKVKRLLFSSSNKKLISAICSKEAENYFLDDKTWLLFEDVLKEIPIQGFQQEIFANNAKAIDIKDSMFHYLVVVKEIRIKDNVSPMQYERDNIKSVILQARRIKLLERLRIETKKNAKVNSDYELFFK